MKITLTLLTTLLLAPLAALRTAGLKPVSEPTGSGILFDDFGRADLFCCGSTFHEWHSLEKLAGQGMRFIPMLLILTPAFFNLDWLTNATSTPRAGQSGSNTNIN